MIQPQQQQHDLLHTWQQAIATGDPYSITTCLTTIIQPLIEGGQHRAVQEGLHHALTLIPLDDRWQHGLIHYHLADTYYTDAAYDAAHTHATHALELLQQSDEYVVRTMTHSLLGHVALAQGHHDAALAAYTQAAYNTPEQDEHRYAGCLHNIALVLHMMGHHQQALTLIEQALGIKERLYGEDHPDTIMSLANLAVLLAKEAKYITARPLFEHAVTVCEQTLGEQHPVTMCTMLNFAAFLLEQGEYSLARRLLERVYAIRQQVFGESHPDTVACHKLLIHSCLTPEQ